MYVFPDFQSFEPDRQVLFLNSRQHKLGGDRIETIPAVPVDPNNRLRDIGKVRDIDVRGEVSMFWGICDFVYLGLDSFRLSWQSWQGDVLMCLTIPILNIYPSSVQHVPLDKRTFHRYTFCDVIIQPRI
jgi:hypothetical protein